MKITKKWLKVKGACDDGVEWFCSQKEKDGVKVVEALMAEEKYCWADWLIVRIMTRPQYLSYAIFASEQVIDIFEKQYPYDKSPRKAIETAKAVLKNDTKETEAAAEAAARAARDAEAAARAARAAVRIKILQHGISLLKGA